MTSSRRSAACVALVVALAGCSAAPAGAPDPSAAASAAVAGALPALRSEVRRHTSDVPRRTVKVFVTNTGTATVDVRQLRLRSPMFAPVAPVEAPGHLTPGRALDLRVPFGAAVCPAPSGPDLVDLIADAGAGPVPAVLTLPSPQPVLQRLHTAECAGAAIRDVVDLSYAPWRPARVAGAEVLLGQFVVRRRGPAAADAPRVVVSEFGGSIVATVAPTDEAAGTALEPTATELRIPVELRPARCDLHALIEAKDRWSLRVFVALAGQEPQRLDVPAAEDQAPLDAYLDRACGIT